MLRAWNAVTLYWGRRKSLQIHHSSPGIQACQASLAKTIAGIWKGSSGLERGMEYIFPSAFQQSGGEFAEKKEKKSFNIFPFFPNGMMSSEMPNGIVAIFPRYF